MSAQVKFGVKAGLYTFNIAGSIKLKSPTDSFKLAIKNANYGYNFGVFTEIKAGPIFLRPEVIFNSNKVDYTLKNLKTPNADTLRSERYNNIDIPFMIGKKIGPLNVILGPVAHISVGGTSTLTNTSGYSSKFATALWGGQVGLLASLGEKLVLDFKYEFNFDKFGSNITYNGTQYSFAKSQRRFMLGMGYKF
jgi:hypothetical protein